MTGSPVSQRLKIKRMCLADVFAFKSAELISKQIRRNCNELHI